jgi:hypothetical protein
VRMRHSATNLNGLHEEAGSAAFGEYRPI